MTRQPARTVTRERTAVRVAAAGVILAAGLSLTAPSASARQADGDAVRPPPAPGVPSAPATGGPQTPGARTPPAPKKPAPPQTSSVWKGRGFAAVSGGAQLAAPGYTSTAVFTVHAEPATLEADASVGIGPAFGVRGGVRVWKNMAVGGGVELASTKQSLTVSGRLPHPFQFNSYREVSGTADGLDRADTLVALELSWLAALSRRIDMLVFGGPAYLHVRQAMAARIQFTESYPYDTATFTGVETTSVSGGGFGATGGLDVSYLLTKHVGLGLHLRYSYASTMLTPSIEPASVPLGGLQAAVGARMLF